VPSLSTLSSSLAGFAGSAAGTALFALGLGLRAVVQDPLAARDGCLVGRNGRLKTACEVSHGVGRSLRELGSDGHRGLAGGTLGVKSLDALDVGTNLDALTLDGSVPAHALDVLVVGLSRGETGGSEWSGLSHVV
jgi:hypothetical protein